MALQGVLELWPLQVLLKPMALEEVLGLWHLCSHRVGATLQVAAGEAKPHMPQVGMLLAGGLGMPREAHMHLAAVGDTGQLGDTGREVGAGSQAGVVGRLAEQGQGTQAVGQGTGHTGGPQEVVQAWEVQFGADLHQGLSAQPELVYQHIQQDPVPLLGLQQLHLWVLQLRGLQQPLNFASQRYV